MFMAVFQLRGKELIRKIFYRMNTPFFSIIIPTFNRDELIVKAIESVINQTFTNWELIIVDDGSTDNTKNIVLDYLKDNRVKYYYQSNSERSAARNNGISNSNGEYICFLDSDDYFNKSRLEQLYSGIKSTNYSKAFFYTGICFENKGNFIEKEVVPQSNFTNVFDFILTAIIGTPQACIHREILIKHKFDSRFRIGEDMELWVRIATDYPFIYLPQQSTIVAVNHSGRSVNINQNNYNRELLRVFKHMIRTNSCSFSIKAKLRFFSQIHFGISKYYILHKKRFRAVKHIFLSICYNFINNQTKYKINILINILFNLNKAISLVQN